MLLIGPVRHVVSCITVYNLNALCMAINEWFFDKICVKHLFIQQSMKVSFTPGLFYGRIISFRAPHHKVTVVF